MTRRDGSRGFESLAEFLRAALAAQAGGPADPRLGPPLPEPAPLTGRELAAMEAFANSLAREGR